MAPPTLRASSSALLFGFTVTARELGKPATRLGARRGYRDDNCRDNDALSRSGKLHVPGQHADCLAALARMEGVAGLAKRLCTQLTSGISGDEQDVVQRQQAYVYSGLSGVLVTTSCNSIESRWIACFFACVLQECQSAGKPLLHRYSSLCRYGKNVFPEPPFAGFWPLFFDSFKDPILIILIIAACIR